VEGVPIEQDVAKGRLVEPDEEVAERALAGAAATDDE